MKKEGFTLKPGKGSHRKFQKGNTNCVISGKEGADAKRYQENDVKAAIKEARS